MDSKASQNLEVLAVQFLGTGLWMQLHTAVRRQAVNMNMLVWLFFLVEAYMAVRALSIELYYL